MKRLYIIDMSGLVWHAMTSPANCQRSYLKMPIGGIYEALQEIARAYGDNGYVIAAFDSKTSIRKNKMSTYKGGRTPNRAVYAQLDFLYEQLSAIGVTCLKMEGYEADDLINWSVLAYRDSFDEITILSGDEDITHNVQQKVTYIPFVKGRAIVNSSNFVKAVHKGREIAFNTISAYKVFCGCNSDSIPAFKSEYNAEELYDAYVKVLRDNGFYDYDRTSSRIVLDFFIDNSGLFSDEQKEELKERADVIFPLKAPDNFSIEIKKYLDVDKAYLAQLLSMCNNYRALKYCRLRREEVPESLKQIIKDYAYALETGAYAVDNNLEVDPSYVVDSETIYMEDF